MLKDLRNSFEFQWWKRMKADDIHNPKRTYTRMAPWGDNWIVFGRFPDHARKSYPMGKEDAEALAEKWNDEALEHWYMIHVEEEEESPVLDTRCLKNHKKAFPILAQVGYIPHAGMPKDTSNQTPDRLWLFGNTDPDFDNWNDQNG